MIKTIRALSRKKMTAMAPELLRDPASYIISITDPRDEPIFDKETERCTLLQFHDIDTMINGYILCDAMHGDQIITLLERAHAASVFVDVWVNCEAGMSRSGAVAAFVQQHYMLEWGTFQRLNPGIYPNIHVKTMLREAMERRNGQVG